MMDHKRAYYIKSRKGKSEQETQQGVPVKPAATVVDIFDLIYGINNNEKGGRK